MVQLNPNRFLGSLSTHIFVVVQRTCLPGHVDERVQDVERVSKRVAAVLFGHVRRHGRRIAAAVLYAVLDHVMDQVHGPAHLAEHRVPVLARLRTVRVSQACLQKQQIWSFTHVSRKDHRG